MLGFVQALQNLTRIYVYPVPYEEETFGKSSVYFPLVGLLIGSITYLVAVMFIQVFSKQVVAAIVVALQFVLTGGMHLDGFMDSIDGLLSGRARDRKLEIMRDSRVGAFGVIGVVMLVLLKFTMLTEVPLSWWFVFIFMGVISRWALVYSFYSFPYARKQGMGLAYHNYTGTTQLAIASIITLAVTWLGWQGRGIALLGVVGLITHLIGRKVTKSIGGLTGDVYGFISEFNEVVVLFLVLLFAKI